MCCFSQGLGGKASGPQPLPLGVGTEGCGWVPMSLRQGGSIHLVSSLGWHLALPEPQSAKLLCAKRVLGVWLENIAFKEGCVKAPYPCGLLFPVSKEGRRMRHSTSRQFVLISDTHLPELLKMNYTSYRNRTFREFHSSCEN